MGNRIFLIIFCFVFVSTIESSIAANTKKASATNWELISETNGIKVFERWITNSSKIKVRERTGRMTLNCSTEDVLDIIHDADQTHLWMRNAETVEVLKVVDDKEWYVHTILDTPWPFSKQDMVSKYTIVKSPDKDIVRVLIVKEDKLLPPLQEIDRLDSFSAVWIIESVKKNRVKVTFTTTSTKPPKYPSWAQDPVVRKVFTSNLRNFKALINNKS